MITWLVKRHLSLSTLIIIEWCFVLSVDTLGNSVEVSKISNISCAFKNISSGYAKCAQEYTNSKQN